MEDFATQVFTFENDNSNSAEPIQAAPHMATVQLNASQIHYNPQIEIEKEADVQEELENQQKKSKKIKDVNPYYSYFPNFYRKELQNSLIVFVIWSVVLGLAIGLCSYLCYLIVHNKSVDNWCLLTLIPILGAAVGFFILYLFKFLNFRCEAKTINFKDEKVISNNILKKYKTLKTSYINVSWACLLSYTICLLMILVDCIVCWIRYRTKFGDVITPIHEDHNYAYAGVFWGGVGVVIFSFIMHVVLLLTAYIRYSRVENYYNFPIVPAEELTALKKKSNRRDLIIYLAVIGTLGLVCWWIIRTVKRTKKTQITVSQ